MYNLNAFNDPRLWGVGQGYNMGQAVYANWQNQFNDILGFENQIQQWNAQRMLDPLQQTAAASKLGLDIAGNSAGITGVGDAYVGRAQALATQRASEAQPKAQEQPKAQQTQPEQPDLRRIWERLGLMPMTQDGTYAMDLFGGQ